MAPAIPFIAAAFASWAVSSVVGYITGNEMIATVAGAVVGFGVGSMMAPAGAAAAGSAATSSTAAPTVAGGAGMSGASGAGFGGSAAGMPAQGLGGSLATVGQGGTASIGGAGITAGGGAAGAGAGGAGTAATSAGSGGWMSTAGGYLSKGAQFLDDHPVLTETLATGIQAAMSDDDGLGVSKQEGENAIELAREKARLEREGKEAVDVNAVLGLSSVDRQPVRTQFDPNRFNQPDPGVYQPQYMTRQDPNYQSLLQSVYTAKQEESDNAAA